MSGFFTIFISIFLAEFGDKTQIATLLFASDGSRSKFLVFIAAAGALLASSAIAVLLGAAADRYLSAAPLKLIAGLGFILVGGLMVLEHFRAA